MKNQQSLSTCMAEELRRALRSFRIGPTGGGRARPVIWGVTDGGTFVGEMTADAFLDRAAEILTESRRVYRFGNTLVYELSGPGEPGLLTLSVQHRPVPHVAGILANLFVLGVMGEERVTQSLPPAKLVNAVLVDEGLSARLPEILHYCRRPCFDEGFALCRPGWNAASGILVHGPDVEPAMGLPAPAPGADVIDQLPPHLRALLREFAWRSPSDPTNALGLLLTGVAINHLIDEPHPIGIVDGNQPATGKTLLVQTIGRVLDGAEPPRIPLAGDAELEKRLCAQLLCSRSSLFFLDNVRTKIESAILEANVLSPLISLRILGKSATIERPNTYLWMITSNLTAGTPDLISRGVAVRLHHEGDPGERQFQGNPLQYATDHRLEILGELVGMILRWVEQGRPPGNHRHRCQYWAAVIGGILNVNNLGDHFLANAGEAAADMDQSLLDLATLAEHVVAKDLVDLYALSGPGPASKGKPPGQWVSVVSDARILRDKLAEMTAKAKATAVGIFLASKVDRRVTIETAPGPRTATLRRRVVAGNQKLYFFEIAVSEGVAAGPTSAAATVASAPPLSANGSMAATLDGPGSGNETGPWSGAAQTDATPAGPIGSTIDTGPQWL